MLSIMSAHSVMAVAYSAVIILCIALINLSIGFHNTEVIPSCSEDHDICEFHFYINYMATMVLYDKDKMSGVPVVFRDGKLYKRDRLSCDTFSPLTKQEMNDVVTVEGTRKILMVVNQEFPGTPIVVYGNQTVVINVHNELFNEGVSLHWHGMVQKGTPWMDGATMVTQCPINPGQTFQYRFKADPVGTHWYHSHQGTERTDGLSGPFIVLPRSDKKRKDLPDIEKEFYMFIQDWFRDESSLDINLIGRWQLQPYSKDYNSTVCFNIAKETDGTTAASMPFHAALINGKGHYFPDKGDMPEIDILPLETFLVKRNKFYKFRAINAATLYSFRVSIDQHLLQIVATDGNDVKPKEVESVILNPGERFDIIIEANAKKGNYWLRVETLEAKDKDGNVVRFGKTFGILRYIGAPDKKPTTKRKQCTEEHPCMIANCPFPKFYDFTECLPITDLKSTYALRKSFPVPIVSRHQKLIEVFLNFHFTSLENGRFNAAVNGRVFTVPSCPPQVIYEPTSQVCFDDCHDKDCTGYCKCSHTLALNQQLGEVIQIVMVNNDIRAGGVNHPIHVHGHHFHVMKIAHGEFDKDTGKITGDNKDITCSGLNCMDPSWSNPDWKDGNIPDLNLNDPPMKDTVIVPRKGYTVIRFPADNPGYWYIHCHVETHQLSGMAVILKEGLHSEMAKPPRNFPLCGSFKWSKDEFEEDIKIRRQTKNLSNGHETDGNTDQSEAADNDVDDSDNGIGISMTGLVLGVGLMIFFTLFVGLVVYTSRLQKQLLNTVEYMPLLGSKIPR